MPHMNRVYNLLIYKRNHGNNSSMLEPFYNFAV